MTNYQAEQFMLEEQFVKRLLIDYGIREITTQKQAKNETREFEFPVPSFSRQRLKYYTEHSNPSYKCVWQRQNGELYTSRGMTKARALIHSPITRLNFMLNYYLKNYANN